MPGRTQKLEIKPELHDILYKRLKDMGWDSVRHFTLGSMIAPIAESLGVDIEAELSRTTRVDPGRSTKRGGK